MYQCCAWHASLKACLMFKGPSLQKNLQHTKEKKHLWYSGLL